MELSTLLQGLIIGFSIAAPVGPIGVLCIRRTLSDGRMAGLLSGMGAATADALYGTVAAFGLTFVTGLLVSQQGWLRLAGGLFLLYLGWQTLRSVPAERAAGATGIGLAGAYTSTLFLTITNPMTIISFAAIFAGVGLGSAGGNYALAALLVLGVFAGSAAWWLILSGGVNLFRSRFTPASLRWVNVLSGFVITGFGLVALASLLLGTGAK